MLKQSTRILGIDPGTGLLGYGIIDCQPGQFHLVVHGHYRTPAGLRNAERVLPVFDFFDKLIKRHQPDQVALEQLFIFKNQKTVMAVSEMRGVLLLVAARHGVPIREFTPAQVKQAVSGYGRADKTQVQRMTKLILGLTAIPKPDDVADALALAICCANTIVF